jgi:hypothetical protein
LYLVIAGSAVAAPVENRPELRVLLVVDRPNDPFIERIRAEVVALGLSVVTRGPVGPLEADARAQQAVAAIRVLASRKGVEVWMADVTTGRTLARQLIVDERPQGPDQTLIALQTSEILRTSLFPQAATPRPTPPSAPVRPPEPPPPIAQPARPSSESAIVTGFGPYYSPGGASASFQEWLSLQRRWQRGFGVALDGSWPILRGSLSRVEGSALVGAYTLGAEIFATLPAKESKWVLTAGIGGGVLYLRTVGESNAALVGTSASKVVGHGYARVEAGVRLSSWARLALTTLAGTTFQSVTIRYAGNPAGSWGSVLLAAFLSFGAEWE